MELDQLMMDSGLTEWFNKDLASFTALRSAAGKLASLVAAAERERINFPENFTAMQLMVEQGPTIREVIDLEVNRARLEERERCAKVCEERGERNRIAAGLPNGDRDEFYCADDIRALD